MPKAIYPITVVENGQIIDHFYTVSKGHQSARRHAEVIIGEYIFKDIYVGNPLPFDQDGETLLGLYPENINNPLFIFALRWAKNRGYDLPEKCFRNDLGHLVLTLGFALIYSEWSKTQDMINVIFEKTHATVPVSSC